MLWFARDLPRPDSALDATRRPSLTLEDRSGHVFARFGDVVGEPLHLSRDAAPTLPEAAVAVEDRRFWHHPGIDLIGMARAAWTDLMSGTSSRAAARITQQVAKNLFLSNARTFRRKVQELLLTLWLNDHFTKREILEIYLNRVYLGAGAWGVDAAAHVYFGVSARHVTLWQAAVLAGLPRAPSRFNPRVNPAAATARAKEVLAAMVETGAITEAQAAGRRCANRFPASARHRRRLVRRLGRRASGAGSLAVIPTPSCAPRWIRTSRRWPNPAGMAAGWARARRPDVSQGAVVVLDAASGAVRAHGRRA